MTKGSSTILVHTTYASKEDTLVLQGYIWERLPSLIFSHPPPPQFPFPRP